MSRDISIANQNASSASVILPVYFVALNFGSGNVFLHTQLGTISWGGNDYIGTGGISGISPVDEDTDLARSTLQLTLFGLPDNIISIVLNESFQGRTATIYFGYLNLTTHILVDNPFIVFRGRMDTASVEQGETCSVSLTVESRFAAWDRPLVRRYNNADQQSRFPGDRGLEFVEQTTEKQIVWGQAYAS